MKKVYVDQHGRLGDILYTLPIAKRLMEKEYEVFFYIHKNYSNLIEHFPEVNFIEYDQPIQPPMPQEPCILLPLWHAKNYIRKNQHFSYFSLVWPSSPSTVLTT